MNNKVEITITPDPFIETEDIFEPGKLVIQTSNKKVYLVGYSYTVGLISYDKTRQFIGILIGDEESLGYVSIFEKSFFEKFRGNIALKQK